MTFLSDSELESLRDEVLALLPGTCRIVRPTVVTDTHYFADELTTATVTTSVCRVDPYTTRQDVSGMVAGREAQRTYFMVTLPYDTDIAAGDAVQFGEERLEVIQLWDTHSSRIVKRVLCARMSIGEAAPELGDLLFWFEANSAAVADGGAISAWPSLQGTLASVVQATSSKQPVLETGVLNGHPVARFDGTADEVASAASISVPETLTLFIVAMLTATGTLQNFVLLGAASGGLQVRAQADGRVFVRQSDAADHIVQGATTLQGGRYYIISVTYDGTDGALYLNGFADAEGSRAVTFADGPVVIGSRSGAQWLGGDVAEVIAYNRVLSDDEREAEEQYLANKYALTLTPWDGVLYVDSVDGSDTNIGAAEDDALLTLGAAFTKIASLGGGTIRVTAAAATPLRETITYTGTADIAVEGNGADWYWYATEQHTSGWVAAGGGVYSKNVGAGYPSSLNMVAVSDVADADGFWTRLVANAATPTTPAPGEYGWVSGTTTLYVRLSDSSDPNTHTIEASKHNFALLAQGTGGVQTGTVSLTDAVIYGGGIATLMAGGSNGGGVIEATDVTTRYSGNTGGFAVRLSLSSMTCTRCVAEAHGNDGFNLHGSAGVANTMTLIDCEGAYNGDEGASPHDDTVMTIIGGTFHHNQSAGITATNNAELHVTDAVCEDNGQSGSSSATGRGGIVCTEASSGSVTDVTLRDNWGAGFYCDSTGEVTLTRVTSGVAQGNSLADVECA